MEPCKYEHEIGAMSADIKRILVDISSIYKKIGAQIPVMTAVLMGFLLSLCAGLITYLVTIGLNK